MSENNRFLSRWARRKAEAAKLEAGSAVPALETPIDVVPVLSDAIVPSEGALPAFDISTLPSIESLTANSDLSMFMQFGVPDSLRNAALRRMWVTDTSIRDYIGLSDYAWDFHTPGALPGHGELEVGTDVSRLIRQFTNDLFESEKEPPPQDIPVEQEDASTVVSLGDERDLELRSHTDDDGEIEHVEVLPDVLAPSRRRHGGAMPR